MELIRGLHNLRERHRGCVLSIGNFDGFHLGHQALVQRLRHHAAQLNLPAVVQIFEPTPREYFSGHNAPGRIASLRGKLHALAQAGVDYVHCLRFGRQLAGWPAERYVEEMLVGKLGVKAVLVGDDFKFGAGRGGDFALLQKLGSQYGFTAEALGTVQAGGLRVSSSAVREALAVPDLEKCERLLGRPYRYLGRVRPGLQLGRTLNMPTANIPLKRKLALRQGVYAVQARVDSAIPQPGVASLGVRPTLGGTPCLLEVHLFKPPGELYGKLMDVRFVEFLRAEEKFDSLDALAAQMKKDCDDAKRILGLSRD